MLQIIEVKQAIVGTWEHRIDRIAKPGDAFQIIEDYIGDRDREHFIIVLLNIKNHIVGLHTVSIGTLNSTLVHPREVFKAAVLANAAGIICGHNHPSGDPTASPEDIKLTERLVKAGETLGIEVIDHVIVGNGTGRFYSLREHGLI